MFFEPNRYKRKLEWNLRRIRRSCESKLWLKIVRIYERYVDLQSSSYLTSQPFSSPKASLILVSTKNRNLWPEVCFSKTFRAREVIFSRSFSKNREVYTPETSCMKRTSVHIKNMWVTQLCNHKVWDFTTAFRVQKLFGTFEKRASDSIFGACAEYSSRTLSQSDFSDLTATSWIADFRCWTSPEVAILGADQKERGLWGRECVTAWLVLGPNPRGFWPSRRWIFKFLGG